MSPFWNLVHDLNGHGVLSTLFLAFLIVLLVGTVHTRGRS